MQLSGNTILITGGATGIGLGLTERFVQAGNEVIICGRRESALQEAQSRYPGIHYYVADVAEPEERESLFDKATADFPNLNVLVNNAGIQRRLALTESEPWEATRQEIAINLEAPIHLAQLFLPHLLQQPNPAILNVTSGLSFTPLASVPVYSATKAALHSFTLSLRTQLAKTPIEVIEIVPPAVDTDLGGPGLHTFGVPLGEFSDAVFEGLRNQQPEIAYGTALKASRASREELDEIHRVMSERFS